MCKQFFKKNGTRAHALIIILTVLNLTFKMQELFKEYSGKICCTEKELTTEFTKIYQNDKHIQRWLNKITLNLNLKDDEKANKLRSLGNDLYKDKRFKESFEAYTKGICTATLNGKEIGLLMSNRSALLYMIDCMEDCLRDIDFSLQCANSDDVKAKLLVRKVKCYAKINDEDKLDQAKKNALGFLETSLIINKDNKRAEILSSKLSITGNLLQKFKEELPALTKGSNDKFLYASSLIRISYDTLRGRHILANDEIEADDVLFVEKPFIFAPIFVNDEMDMSWTKCYNCLRSTYSSIPCNGCTKTIYCSKNCRDKCWDDYHKWECFGMQCNLWYHIGIGFPAFRAVIRGMPTDFCTLTDEHQTDTGQFGAIENNYPFFNKLLSNISQMNNILPLIVSAGVIVSYLHNHTSFFDEQLPYEKTQFIGLIGGRLVKHMAQLQCNSSVVDHVNNFILDEGGSIACAIYPSISMMNHSCKANIKISYIEDVAVVRAAVKIGRNEEIFNCYGIDYRYMDRESRRDHLSQLYYFHCQCKMCKHVS